MLIYMVMAMGALMGIAAWSLETGRMWRVKSQIQAVADTAALAAVSDLFGSDFTTINQNLAYIGAQQIGPAHSILGDPVFIDGTDIQSGSWDLETRTFTHLPASTNADEVRAVRVVARRDSKANGEVPTIFAGYIFGSIDSSVSSIAVNGDAIAYWGFAGSADAGVSELPIAIDCCDVAGNTPGSPCEANYCTEITTSAPNLCALDRGGQATCLDFEVGGSQNACWTEFDSSGSSINNSTLNNLVANGSPAVGGPIYVGRGERENVVDTIKDRFEGIGQAPAGVDTDGDSVIDSWVVRLPILECQNPGGRRCSNSQPQTVTGYACFEVQEVEDDQIRGRFLCPSDVRCVRNGLGPGGTIAGALSSQSPVIVE